MRCRILTIAALTLAMPSIALAQTASTTVAPAPAPASADKDTVKHASTRQQIVGDLQQSGFTDVKVMPELLPSSGQGQVGQSDDDAHRTEFNHRG